jgi:hypothetical protein
LLYLAPERRGAAILILGSGCIVAATILSAIYSFNLGSLFAAAGGVSRQSQLFAEPLSFVLLMRFLLTMPAFLVMFLTAILTFIAWPRSRFFGNTAPLLVFAALVLLGFVLPNQSGFTFLIVALPFVYVFTGGVFADLLEGRAAPLARALLIAAIASHAALGILQLASM